MELGGDKGLTDMIQNSVLVVLWLGAVGAMISARTLGLSGFDGVGQITALAFIVMLVVWMWRTRLAAPEIPTRQPNFLGRLSFKQALVTILGVVVILFLVAFAAHPTLVFVAVLTLLSCWQIAVRWKDVSRPTVIGGLTLGGLCLLLSFFSGRLDIFQAFYLLCTPVLFVGGSVMSSDTGLGRVFLSEGRVVQAGLGLLIGCVLAAPAALLNVSYGAHSGDGWVDHAWEPLLAIVPAIAEESWARLFLLTFIYAVLRPKTAGRSALLCGVPMGLIFVRFGFEHAVGYHFFIDLIRFAVAYATN